jgi:outer membrane protein assembly factor BamB
MLVALLRPYVRVGTVLTLVGSCLGAGCGPSPAGIASRELRARWRTPIDSLGGTLDRAWFGVPAADESNVYVDVLDGIAAVRWRDGARAWSVPLPHGGGGAKNVVLRDGMVVVAGDDRVVALDAESGAVRWETGAGRVQTTGGRTLSASDDRNVYAGTPEGGIVALDLATGALRWRVPLRDAAFSTAAFPTGIGVSGDTVYVALSQPIDRNGSRTKAVVVALDRATGSVYWRFVTAGQRSTVDGAPVVAGRMLVLADPDSASVFAVDRFRGEEAWRVMGDTRFVGPRASPVVSGDTAYAGSNDTFVYAVHVPTGRLLWKTETEASINAIGLCGRTLVVNNFLVQQIDRFTGRVVRTGLGVGSTSSGAAIPSSGFATDDNRAALVTRMDVVGLDCR